MSAPEKDELLEQYAVDLGMTELEMIEFCKSVLEDKGFRVIDAEGMLALDPNAQMTDCQRFRHDMEEAGYSVRDYAGRFFWRGPAVYTDENGHPTKDDVTRATRVPLQHDQLGYHFVVYPVEREGVQYLDKAIFGESHD